MRKMGGRREEKDFLEHYFVKVARDAAHLSYLYIIHYALHREPKKEYID